MEQDIFSKPPAYTPKHYSILLKKKEISTNKEEFFGRPTRSPSHLYTSQGILKGHRRAASIPNKKQNSEETPESHKALTEALHWEETEEAESSVEALKSQVKELKLQNKNMAFRIQELETELQKQAQENLELKKHLK